MRSFDRSSSNKTSASAPRPNKPIVPRTTPNPRLPRPSEYLKAPSFFTPKTTKPLPSRGATTPTTGRPALRVRDNNQNAPSLKPKPATTSTSSATSTSSTTPKLSTRSRIASAASRTMPVGGGDHNNPHNRPRQPQLSAAAARAGHRPPLTPKVATPKQAPAASPLAARRAQTNKEDGSTTTTASPFLANVTPRTGTRQTRVESTSTTPSGTPNPDKNFEGWDGAKSGLGVSNLGLESVNKALSSVDGQQQQESADAKFFYASDARPTSQGSTQQQSRPASVPQKPTTFFYANGTSTEAKRTTSPPTNAPSFTPVLTTTPEPTSTKFFYANGTPDHITRPGLTTSGSGSTVSSSSRMPNSRPGTGHSVQPAPSVTSRPMSPVKSATIPSVTPSLQSSALSPGPSRSVVGSPALASGALASGASSPGKRRVSIEVPSREATAPPTRGHARTGSVPTFEQLVVPKYARSPQSPESMSPPLSPGLTQPAMTMASILQAAEDFQGDDDARDDESQPEPQSPTKSVHSNDPLSELVANARRERKVQDLEITNASLEAINRTLERQLRKQTAELRRYRRLSRSGRFSMASGQSSRVTSAMTDPPFDLSEFSAEDDETEADDLESMHESDFSSDEATSTDDPTSPNAKMAARRKRDEIRLQLDLSKHQELLIDSQKINQSIKRCLDWTEVLIKDGQKALDYHVRVSDVELGGHVLAPPDEDDEGDTSYQEEDTAPNTPPTLEPPQGKSVQDRDSGVELPVETG